MRETKTKFFIDIDKDDFNVIYHGWHNKAKKDRCPKCKSDCLLIDNTPFELGGKCAKCGYWGRRIKFKVA